MNIRKKWRNIEKEFFRVMQSYLQKSYNGVYVENLGHSVKSISLFDVKIEIEKWKKTHTLDTLRIW